MLATWDKSEEISRKEWMNTGAVGKENSTSSFAQHLTEE